MRITVYWVTRNPDVIVRIRKKFNIPSYTSVNYETECEIKNEDFPLLEETERRGFIRIRNKLSLGNDSRGWFDFIPRTNGNLSIKWRGPV